jgi:hypothetical protein
MPWVMILDSRQTFKTPPRTPSCFEISSLEAIGQRIWILGVIVRIDMVVNFGLEDLNCLVLVVVGRLKLFLEGYLIVITELPQQCHEHFQEKM